MSSSVISQQELGVAKPWGTYRPSSAARLLIAASRMTLLGRGALRSLLFRAFVRLQKDPIDCVVWGVPVRLHVARNACERKALLCPDRMDKRERALMREHMRRPGATFVDVGANVGLYSLDAAINAGPSATIVAIEPNSELLARFAFNIATARSAARIGPDIMVRTVNLAVSDHEGEGVLSSEGSEGTRSLIEGGSGQRVELRRLSTILASQGISMIDVLKIDVEGHEDKVLPPYLESSASGGWPKVIIIEHLSRRQWSVDCIDLALSKGYLISFSTRNNTVLVRP